MKQLLAKKLAAWLEPADVLRTLISERIKDAKRQLRATGRHQGGDAPFGFRIVKEPGPHDSTIARLKPVAAEQTALADMARMRSEGLSLRAIAEELQGRGFRISYQSVKRALARTAATAAGGAA